METVKINMVPKGAVKAAHASQGDAPRVVRFELFDELLPYTLDGSEDITLKVVRPDTEEIVSSVTNTEEAYIDVSFTSEMTAIQGVANCEIKISKSGAEIGSHNFDLNIERGAYNARGVIIETASGTLAEFDTVIEDNALEYESEIPYNAEGYTGLRVINTRTAPVYNKTPYLFRKTPSGYGNSCIEKLTGLSVAFNQLLDDNNYKTGTYSDIVVTKDSHNLIANGKANGNAYIKLLNNQTLSTISGHKYLVNIPINGKAYYYDDAAIRQYNAKTTPFIFQGSGIALSPHCRIDNGITVTNEIIYMQMFDLTQMFGSTIADYIYNLETAQAGAGVAYFKNLFGADYYPFNAGELMSSKPTSKKVVGFNQFDEETELGGISQSDGSNISNPNYYRSKNYIPIIQGVNYYFCNRDNNIIGLRFYNANKEYLGSNAVVNSQSLIYGNNLLPSGTAFIRFLNTSTNTYNNNICINISDPEKNGTYEPYNAVTYPLDPDLELRGILKLDANNKLYGDGDIYESSGDITRRYGIVDLGSLTWGRSDYGTSPVRYRFSASMPSDYKKPSTTAERLNLICPKFVASLAPTTTSIDEDNTICGYDNSYTIYIRCDSYTDAASFKTAMNGVYLVYPLATPTTESSTPFDNPQEVKVTEEFIDGRAVEIPVGHDTIYGTDIEYQDIDFDTTIFGGDINAIDGVLSSEYNSDGSVKPTPEIIDITPTPIPVRAGDNVIFNSAEGNQTIRYYNQVE